MKIMCKNCIYWREEFSSPDEPDDERLGSCGWPGPIPYAWRWATREVVGVYASEGEDCPTFTNRSA